MFNLTLHCETPFKAKVKLCIETDSTKLTTRKIEYGIEYTLKTNQNHETNLSRVG